MKRLLLLAALLPASALASPFCAVTGAGTQCVYFTMSACLQAVRGMDGACIANIEQVQQSIPQYAQPRPAPQYQPSLQQNMQSVYEAGERGAAAGRQTRLRRLLGEVFTASPERQQVILSEIASLDFDIYTKVAQELRSSAEPPKPEGLIIYRCGEGPSATYTKTPAPGCTVIAVTP